VSSNRPAYGARGFPQERDVGLARDGGRRDGDQIGVGLGLVEPVGRDRGEASLAEKPDARLGDIAEEHAMTPGGQADPGGGPDHPRSNDDDTSSPHVLPPAGDIGRQESNQSKIDGRIG
jgi:hypothetical protein